MDEKEKQLMDIMACDVDTARRALHQSSGDLERAMDAMMSGTVPAKTQSDALVPYPLNRADAMDTLPPLPQRRNAGEASSGAGEGSVPSSPPLTSWSSNSEGLRRSERNPQKRLSPIDLTNEEDDDDDDANLRRAMQASLEDESTRQKRHQEYGIGGTNRQRAGGISEEDEALTRAIEASMLQQSSHSATRDQSPQVTASQLIALGANQLRLPDRPVAILPPTPFMRIFALALQAMHSSGPLRNAILSVRFADVRVRQNADDKAMQGYWQGVSPAGQSTPTPEQWSAAGVSSDQREQVDGAMRFMTLFAFMRYSKRPLVVADDVIVRSPLRSNYAYVMNSERKPSHDILSCYVQGVLDVLTAVSTEIKKSSSDVCDAEALKKSYQSFTVFSIPVTSQHTAQQQPQSEPYEVVVHSLIQTNVNNSVHRALYACLADEKALYSAPGETLFLCLGRREQYSANFGVTWAPAIETKAGSTTTTFELEPRIYLDAFMFARRNGRSLGTNADEIKLRQDRVDELERYRRSIATHQGEDTRATLKASIAYFGDLCYDDMTDSLRTASIAEAGPRLEAILAHLDEEIAAVDAELQSERSAIDDVQRSTLSSFEEQLKQPEFQTMPYDLQAVLYENTDTSWAYVRHVDDLQSADEGAAAATAAAAANWWRIREGGVEKVSEEEVLHDGNTIIFMVYTSAAATMATSSSPADTAMLDNDGEEVQEQQGSRKSSKAIRLDSSRDWWSKQALVEAIEHDNAQFGTQLANDLQAGNSAGTDDVTVLGTT